MIEKRLKNWSFGTFGFVSNLVPIKNPMIALIIPLEIAKNPLIWANALTLNWLARYSATSAFRSSFVEVPPLNRADSGLVALLDLIHTRFYHLFGPLTIGTPINRIRQDPSETDCYDSRECQGLVEIGGRFASSKRYPALVENPQGFRPERLEKERHAAFLLLLPPGFPWFGRKDSNGGRALRNHAFPALQGAGESRPCAGILGNTSVNFVFMKVM